MGQQNSKYIQWFDNASNIIVSDPKLVVKQSTAKNGGNGGNGVFADEFIPKGTIFCKSNPYDTNEDTISRYTNDLLYQGTAEEYEQNERTNNVTNIGYVRIKEESSTCYCVALVDINKDQELSRYYGANYWFVYDFNEKYKLILEKGGYLPEWIFLDEYRIDTTYNHCYYVFSKCIDGKYYYTYGYNVLSGDYVRINDFNSLPVFKNETEMDDLKQNKFGKFENMTDQTKKEYYNFKCLVDCSKFDLSLYQKSEPIEIDQSSYYGSKYMMQSRI